MGIPQWIPTQYFSTKVFLNLNIQWKYWESQSTETALKSINTIESRKKMALLLLFNDYGGGCSKLLDKANERKITVGRLCYLFVEIYQAINHPTGLKEFEFVISGVCYCDCYCGCLDEIYGACVERKECAPYYVSLHYLQFTLCHFTAL